MDSWPTKDPDEVLDYAVNWADVLVVGETIASSTFTLAAGDVVIGSTPLSGAVATVWLSGGTPGTVSQITNHIVTSASREYEKTVRIRVRSL